MTICLEDRDASNYVLRDHNYCTPDRTRTRNLLIRIQVLLIQLSYRSMAGVIIYCLCSDMLRKRSSQKKTLIKYTRRESNPYFKIRSLAFYSLNYRGIINFERYTGIQPVPAFTLEV